MEFEKSKTFIIVMTAIVLSFAGVWLKMFDVEVFTNALQWGMAVYGGKTIIGKQINKTKETQ